MESKGYKERLPVILILLLQNFLTSEAIQCYKCMFATYVTPSNDTFLCKDFDYSDKFITDCPYSTLCVKKNTHAIINAVQINGTERDCASQRFDTQHLKNGRWQAETRVEEPYEAGCKTNQDKGLRTASVEYCYCRGELCNSGNALHGSNDVYYYKTFATRALGVVVILNIGRLVTF